MGQAIRAIDLLCYPPTRQETAAAPGTLECFEPPLALLRRMDEAGVEKAFITQCKKWSCERQWMCVDTRLEDVLRYTQALPERFLGLAGYNPYDIADSLEEIELAARRHGFRGAYVSAASFRMSLTDPHMYPLFAKAVELGVAVLVQSGNAGGREACFNLRDLERVAEDFEELVLLSALAEWPGRQELERLCASGENLHLVLDPDALSRAPAWAKDFLASAPGSERCCWGSHGADWKVALAQVRALGLGEEIESRLLRDNAHRLFRLDREFRVLPRPRAAPDPMLAER